MESVGGSRGTIVGTQPVSLPRLPRPLPGPKLTEAVDTFVARYPGLLSQLRRAECLDRAGRWSGQAAFYATAFAGLGMLVETGASLWLGGGPPDPVFIGVIAALGGAFGLSLPLEHRPLKRTRTADDALTRAGALLTVMAYDVPLSPGASSSFCGVGGYTIGSPAVLDLVFDRATFRHEHAAEVRAGIEKQLAERGLGGLAPDFVRFKVAFGGSRAE